MAPGTYAEISRDWAPGDTVAVSFQMSLRFEQLNDRRPEWQGVGAVMYGPILMAGEAASIVSMAGEEASNVPMAGVEATEAIDTIESIEATEAIEAI